MVPEMKVVEGSSRSNGRRVTWPVAVLSSAMCMW